ncbi:MAG: putative transport system ATP-binding protein [Solirubrobacteraceae bacterium]|jgi:putative ABC transport system ATP-binding protein|nr:putative transport system ATP-binding protein [Solirubrobacteraceae bacterium]
MLEFSEVSKRFRGPGDDVVAVHGVSLTIEPKEVVAIVGPSGSGKTTLLLLAAGIVAPDEGTVRFRGQDLSTLTESEAALFRLESLGFVFQTPTLMPMSAIENAALPLVGQGMSVRAALHEVAPLLDRVGLSHRRRHRPDQLSGGERQRVAIARALAAGPSLLLADEPTGSLDGQRGAEVLALMRDASRERGVAVVVVTHDPRVMDHADRVHTLEDGVLRTEDWDAAGRRVADLP